MKELKPCPNCGEKERLHFKGIFLGEGEILVFVICKSCGTEGPEEYTEEKAISEWNKRD